MWGITVSEMRRQARTTTRLCQSVSSSGRFWQPSGHENPSNNIAETNQKWRNHGNSGESECKSRISLSYLCTGVISVLRVCSLVFPLSYCKLGKARQNFVWRHLNRIWKFCNRGRIVSPAETAKAITATWVRQLAPKYYFTVMEMRNPVE